MIERLYVHNFRCLENFTLDLGVNRSALMIGRNGTGKTTVLKSLRLIQRICRGAGRVKHIIDASDFTQHRTEVPMQFEVELSLAGKRYKYAISFEWPERFHEARILDERLWVDGNPVFVRRQNQVQLPKGTTFGLDWHVFALSLIEERESISEVKAFFASLILIEPIPPLMASFSEEPSAELQFSAQNYASCLRMLIGQKPAAYGAFESYLRTAIPDFSSIEYVPRGESGAGLLVKFELKNSQRSLSVDFKSLSSGEKCFFLGAYILAANSVGSPVVCLWDEPDSHLSLSEVGQFITSLRKMTNRGGQFIATTHHPETVRKFSDDATFVLTRKSHLEPTVIRPLSDFSYSGDLINALIRDEIIG
jgi:ABC-type polar amino acid transport system ATPase subunit